MKVWFRNRRPIFIAAVLLSITTASHAADPGKLATAGRAILQEKCGRCHAVDVTGDSPLKTAPPMRDIYARFAPRELRAELLEGMVSRHKEMPQIEFSSQDVDAILAHLYSLAIRR